MKRIKRTKKETRINNIENRAYSSLFSIVSFIASFAYVLADVICGLSFTDTADMNNVSAIISLVVLVISAITCCICVKKLHNSAECDYPKMRRICNTLENYAKEIAYLSYMLLAATLLVDVFFNIVAQRQGAIAIFMYLIAKSIV